MTPLSRSLSPQFATVAALFRLAAVERRPEDQPDGYWWVAEIGMTPNPSDPASHRSVNPRTGGGGSVEPAASRAGPRGRGVASGDSGDLSGPERPGHRVLVRFLPPRRWPSERVPLSGGRG